MSDRTNSDVLPRSKRRFPRPGGWARVALVVLAALLLLTLGGVAYATYDYSKDYDGRILPGASVAGVDLGGMSRSDAVAAVARALEPRLDRAVTLHWKKRSWRVTPRRLGATAKVEAAVDEALEASARTSFLDRARMRFLGNVVDFERPVPIRYSPKKQRAFVKRVARRFDRDALDAHLDYSSGWVEVVAERSGRQIRVKRTSKALMRAFKTGSSNVRVAVEETEPEVTRAAFDQVLLLRIGENKLYLYDDGKISHSWTVATGQPEYPTPTGLYRITLKRFMPTWVNPDPDGWGADMPKVIPPGPGNPLGTRALNWDAPAIRFHGTEATYSLGYNASHGCVRLARADVEFLYDRVDVGTPIVSITVGPLKPQYRSAPDPIPVAADGDRAG